LLRGLTAQPCKDYSVLHLTVIAQAVIGLQRARHRADYEFEAPSILRERFFGSNRLSLRGRKSGTRTFSQDYLFSLLFRERGF
jgi:hypothetical protein